MSWSAALSRRVGEDRDVARRPPSAGPADLDDLLDSVNLIRGNVERVIEGKPEVVRLALVVLLAEGHLLIEDVPGVGKTMLAKALARSIDCSVKRIQFTPDLLPSDVTGVSVYDLQSGEFEFKPGAVFANVVVGDEINRASPKTQSALLEAMEERQVTVDGTTYLLESPFMVVATQNPIEMEGTYPLPEAQRDRFTARVSMGYPEPRRRARDARHPRRSGRPRRPRAGHRRAAGPQAHRRGARGPRQRRDQAVRRLAGRRRPARRAELRLGASPRASLHLLRASRAAAGLEGRDYVVPDDVQGLASAVLAHRLLPTAEAQLARRTTESLVDDLVERLPLPAEKQRRR